ncbi:MAG: hypothetical protein QG605_338 [Euryarchaeota archaeon]|jgi:hypothetical protein|nr:hypothetical protein [Euryarchaeota archaeon]
MLIIPEHRLFNTSLNLFPIDLVFHPSRLSSCLGSWTFLWANLGLLILSGGNDYESRRLYLQYQLASKKDLGEQKGF